MQNLVTIAEDRIARGARRRRPLRRRARPAGPRGGASAGRARRLRRRDDRRAVDLRRLVRPCSLGGRDARSGPQPAARPDHRDRRARRDLPPDQLRLPAGASDSGRGLRRPASARRRRRRSWERGRRAWSPRRSWSRSSAASPRPFSTARASTSRWRRTVSSSGRSRRSTRVTTSRRRASWRRPSGRASSSSPGPTSSSTPTSSSSRSSSTPRRAPPSIVLRRAQPATPRPYRTWGYPWVPALFILSSLALMANTLKERPMESFIGLGLLVLGLPAYAAWRRQARRI